MSNISIRSPLRTHHRYKNITFECSYIYGTDTYVFFGSWFCLPINVVRAIKSIQPWQLIRNYSFANKHYVSQVVKPY